MINPNMPPTSPEDAPDYNALRQKATKILGLTFSRIECGPEVDEAFEEQLDRLWEEFRAIPGDENTKYKILLEALKYSDQSKG